MGKIVQRKKVNRYTKDMVIAELKRLEGMGGVTSRYYRDVRVQGKLLGIKE